ncbi:MAG: peptide-methionine (R)-S-oxide reductase MsrB [Planctomycetota bacterium]
MEPERDEQGNLVPVEKSAEEWRAQLSDTEYRILREHGTERAWTGRYLDNKRDGVYACAGCGLVLFDSSTKFDSGTGWPSFYDTIADDHVKNLEDNSYGMRRIENVCARCGGHLGHVFPDGPRPTGLRYCMNGYSLRFVERERYEALMSGEADAEVEAQAGDGQASAE